MFVAQMIGYGAVGTCLASFAATAGLRMARGEQALAGRSHCDGCDRSLGFHQTVPLVSYAVARGACPACRARISPAHPLCEAVGLAAGLTAGISADWRTAGLLVMLTAALLAIAVVDAQTQRIPNRLTLLVLALCGSLALLRGAAVLELGAVAAVLTFATLELLRRAYQAARREAGLGFGDVKLMAAMALWLGTLTPWAVALACALGLVVAQVRRATRSRMAFAPALVAAALIVGMARELSPWR